jgi:hypothetical protein
VARYRHGKLILLLNFESRRERGRVISCSPAPEEAMKMGVAGARGGGVGEFLVGVRLVRSPRGSAAFLCVASPDVAATRGHAPEQDGVEWAGKANGPHRNEFDHR